MANILLINGPNLNLLGQREKHNYGTKTLNEINAQLEILAQKLGHILKPFQSNAEHEIINCIHAAKTESIELILINPAAFTHTSIAIRDALLAVEIPFIEIHLSNIYAREEFRQYSYLSDKALGIITGFGSQSYVLALNAADHFFKTVERGE
ncbi:MAG: type II 3-dehydroquinate dehydratase [Pseudomonadota bacterium]